MILELKQFTSAIRILAGKSELIIESTRPLESFDSWPLDALSLPRASSIACQIAMLLEQSLAVQDSHEIRIPYANYPDICRDPFYTLLWEWTSQSPFHLNISRKNDIGHHNFAFTYRFEQAGKEVSVERFGHYIQHRASGFTYHLTPYHFQLLEQMDNFNSLDATEKTKQKSWLAFASVKGLSMADDASLDKYLQSNEVIVPTTIGLKIEHHEDGSISFLPESHQINDDDFIRVFETNEEVPDFYSIDKGSGKKLRVVLPDDQREVLRRMKRVRRVAGNRKQALLDNPLQAFDGLLEHMPYSDRVTGVGDFQFAPMPHKALQGLGMAEIWNHAPSTSAEGSAADFDDGLETSSGKAPRPGEEMVQLQPDSFAIPTSQESLDSEAQPNLPSDDHPGVNISDAIQTNVKNRKYLLIKTNDQQLEFSYETNLGEESSEYLKQRFEAPKSLLPSVSLHPHQQAGVSWMQLCSQVRGRRGVLLADDMGVGKTLQILTFLAWCIESTNFPDLSCSEPPFRPILIVAPLILLDTKTWENEMAKFFLKDGTVFWPTITLHGSTIQRFKNPQAARPEVELGRPIININEIRKHRIVLTNYETLKNYQHSFAQRVDGKPLWSLVITDEAQEYKVPNTRISHAIKALDPDLHIACTGTPVENRLLDLWNICDAFQPGLLSSSREFSSRYEKEDQNPEGSNRMEELKKKLLFQQPHAFLLRRNKSDVAKLPSKTIVKWDCEMNDQERQLHQGLIHKIQSLESKGKFMMVLHEFAQLYQHPALMRPNPEDSSVTELIQQSSKLQHVISELREIKRKREKVIIFARHRAMQAILAKVLHHEFGLPVRIINGETKRSGFTSASGNMTRSRILDEFKSSPGFNVLVLSPFVAGIGLTIVEANHVIHYGRWWNPAVESQATDRAYRIGQTKDVFVYLPILKDSKGKVSITFDERLDQLMESKMRLAEDFLKPLPHEDQIAGELFENMKSEF